MMGFLCFDGAALARSEFLCDMYKPFIAQRNDVCAYFLLQREDNKDVDNNASILAVVGSTRMEYELKSDCLVVSSNGYRCIAKNHFSTIELNSGYLKKLTKAGFTRLNESLYQIARFRALYLNMLVLHASAVVYRDEVILFSGIKGAGKSTQARLWLENTDTWILNYDKPVVKLDEERVLVSGSPWGGKEDLAINEVRPAKALFFVHQAKENRVVRLSSGKAYAEAHLNYFVYPLNEDIEKRYNDSIIQLIKKVPVYDLYCTDTAEAVEAVKRVLYPEEEER